jgi:hypothetical protein
MLRRVPYRWIVWMTVVSILFMQFAVAAYSCPAPNPVLATASAGMCADMDTVKMDPANSALCTQHCQPDKASLDKAEAPMVAPLLVLGILLALLIETVSRLPLFSFRNFTHLQRATAPPLSIRHCCFRI